MRTIFSVLMVVQLLVFTADKVLAQAGVPMGLRGDFNRMQANMSGQMNQRMMNSQWYLFGGNDQVNLKYKFSVVMKDSSVKEVKSKIYADTAKHKNYLLLKEKDTETKIYCDQTLSITRSSGIVNYIGMATDSCWLFRTIRGRVSAYSHVSEIYNITSEYLRAFQVGNGPIQKLDSASLAAVLKDDPKALKAVTKNDYYKAIVKYDGY
jgi:hypothetical protein